MDKNGEDSYMKSNSYAVFFLTVLFLYAVTTHAASLAGNATDGYYINMPASGTETLTIPSGVTSFKVYDDGGPGGTEDECNNCGDEGADANYSNLGSVSTYLVIQGSSLLRVTGLLNTEASGSTVYDVLEILDGDKSGPTLWKQSEGKENISALVSSGNTLTFVFTSDDDINQAGFDLTVSVVDPSEIRTVAFGTAANGSLVSAGNGYLPGQTVSLTAKPSIGYYLKSVKIVDEDDGEVTATINDKSVSFVMPQNNVTITPVFAAFTFDAQGCLADGAYFHMECPGVCIISQWATSTPDNDKDFACWSDLADKLYADYVNVTAHGNAVYLGSDLYMGGYDGTGCAMKSDFKPIYASSFDGKNFTIDGLCQVSSSADAGFLSTYYYLSSGEYENVTFTNAHIEGIQAGVLASSIVADVVVRNIVVDGATVIGNTAGGIAGRMNYNSSYGYTSYLSNVTVKNSTIEAKSVGGGAYNIQAGALAGQGVIRHSVGAKSYFANNKIQVDAAASSSLTVSLGGVFGILEGSSNDYNHKSLTLRGFAISGTSLVDESNVGESNLGGFAGMYVQGYANALKDSIEQVSFEGSIKGGTYVGGIVGHIELPGNYELCIRNTYSTGTFTGSHTKAGYIVGNSLSTDITNGDPDLYNPKMYNNYHYGTDVVMSGLGTLDFDVWSAGDSYMYGNVRNVSGVYSKSGDMGYYEYRDANTKYLLYFPITTAKTIRNGVALEEDMQSDKFAALMNGNVAMNGETATVWARDVDENSGYPIFVDDLHQPLYIVSIDIEDSWNLDEDSQLSKLHAYDGIAVVNGATGTYEFKKILVDYPSLSGNLGEDFREDVTKLVNYVALNTGVSNVMLFDGNGDIISDLKTKKILSSQKLHIEGPESYSVVYNYCTTTTNCDAFDNVPNTFVFMSPKVTAITTDDAVPNQMIPYVMNLTDSKQMTIMDVKIYDDNGNVVKTYDSGNSVRLWWTTEITPFLRQKTSVVSKIEVNYRNNYYSGDVPEISVGASGLTIKVYGVDDAGVASEAYSRANPTVIPYGKMSASCNATPADKTGYAYDNRIAVTYSYGLHDSNYNYDAGIGVPAYDKPGWEDIDDTVSIQSFESIDDLYSKLISGRTVNLVTILAEGSQNQIQDTVDINSLRIVRDLVDDYFTAQGYSLYRENERITVEPYYTLVNYDLTFDLNMASFTSSVSEGKTYYDGGPYLGNNWSSNMVANVEKSLPHVYSASCPTMEGWQENPAGAPASDLKALLEDINSAVGDGSTLTASWETGINCTPPTTIKYINFAKKTGADTYDQASTKSDFPIDVALRQAIDANTFIDHKIKFSNGETITPISVPDEDDTLTFKVIVKPYKGYSIKNFGFVSSPGYPMMGYDDSGSDTTLVINPKLMTTMTLWADYSILPFYVTYNMNTKSEDKGSLFFPVNATAAEKIEFGENVTSVNLWTPYRSDKCFDGWSVVTPSADPSGVATSEPPKMMTLAADYAASALSTDPDAPTELQANWKDCGGTQPAASDVTIANGGTNAKVMLKQVFDGTEYKHLLGNDAFTLPANSSGYKFFIDSANSVVDLGYGAVGISVKYSENGVDHELTVEGDSIEVGNTNVTNYSVTMKTQVALDGHRFWLAGNADTVFYGSSITMLEVHAQKDEPITTDVYRIGYKLKGWSFLKDAPQQAVVAYASNPHLVFDTDFEFDYVMFAKTFGRLPDTLYAVWETNADAGVMRVVNKSKDVSSFRLMQDVGGQMFDYLVSDTLLLPAEGQFEFIVEMLYDSNQVEVDNMHAIVVLDEDGELVDILENNIRYTVEKSIGLRANVLKDKRVQFVLNENSEDQVYFGSDWIDTLASENPDSALVLPTIAYNSAKCLAGWTIDSTSNKLLKVLDKDLLNDLRAKGNAMGRSISELLYARWTTNPDSCVGDFVQLAVQQENGSVWFVEGDKNTKERRFTDEGTMFVPSELDGSQFRVQASGTDTSVYVLDSLVVLRKNKVVGVLKEGDAMPANLKDVSLKAYFGWKNKTEIGFKRNPRLDVNGVRFRLGFKASDFEVRRNVSARMTIFDKARPHAKPPIDTLLGDSIEMGYKTNFMFPMNKPGDYKMVLTLKDKADFVVTDSFDFSVSSEISVLAADTWQMISLSSVDVSAIKNDDDRIFYWWDEEGTGEYWQYKRLDLRDSVNPTLGVWYNSLEGRALPLLTDVDEDDEEDFTWKLENVSTGWNMVANPYNWRLDLYAKNPNAKKSFDEESDISFYRYDAESADPVPVDTIGPYEAVWAYVSKNTKWKMSADPYFPPDAAPLEKRALAKASTKDRWTLQAKLTDVKGKKDSWNILGAGLNPLVADEPPASMGDHVNLAIVEGKRALAKSIKPSSDEMEWTIALSASSDRIGFLSLDGIDGVKAFGYRVFVTVDGNTTEMREGEPLKVYLKSSAKMATVRVAPAAKAVAKNTLKGLRTARLGNRLQVTFDASGLAGTNARVDIVDLKGNVKSTATAKTIEGSNALVLDAPQSGLYMLRVRAGSQQQAVKILVR